MKTTPTPTELAEQITAENALAKARMQVRAEEARRVIAKYGDPGGHLDRYARVLEAAAGPVDTVLCDECGTHTTDPDTCPHGREHCPECRENGYACNQCGAENDPRWNR